MLKNVRLYRIRAICLLIIVLGLVPSGCSLDRQLFLESGNYLPAPYNRFHFARQPEGAAVLMAPIVNAKPLPSSVKGYELYSWYDPESDGWLYTLITGTNRLKTVEEIIDEENQVTQTEWVKITTTGREALKDLLRRLPPGTKLFWLDGERLEGAGELAANFALPEATVVETIDIHCQQLDIQLHMSQ